MNHTPLSGIMVKSPSPLRPEDILEENICSLIFTVSAGMIGVCLTAISLIRVVITIRKANTLVDDFLTLDALLFLFSCLASYIALRKRNVRRMYQLERIADIVFIVAMVLMALACGMVTYLIV